MSVVEDGAGAAHRLGDEERRQLLGVVEGGRVELHELHTAHGPFGAIDHRHAVAGGHLGVGGVLIDHPHAAGGHHRHLGQHGGYVVSGRVEDVGAVAGDVIGATGDLDAEVVLGDDFEGNAVLENLDVLVPLGGLDEFLLNLVAGDVLMVEHSELGVAALLGEGEAAVLVLVEIDAPLHEFHHPLGGLAYGEFHNMAVGELVAGHHRVLNMLLVRVGLVNHGGDAALGVAGGALVDFRLGDHAHLPEISGLQGETEPCHARTNDQKIYFFAHFRHYLKSGAKIQKNIKTMKCCGLDNG